MPSQDPSSSVQGDHYHTHGPTGGRHIRHGSHGSLSMLSQQPHSGHSQAQTTQFPSKFVGSNSSGSQSYHESLVQPSPPQSVTHLHSLQYSHSQASSPTQSQHQTQEHLDSSHSLHQQQQQHIHRFHQQQQQQQEHHHHVQYPSQPATVSSSHQQQQGHPNIQQRQGPLQSGSNNGRFIRHGHSLSHPHIRMSPYQQQNQSQHHSGFEPYPGQQHDGSKRPGLSHSISMPMKPPTSLGMHHPFGGQDYGHHDYHNQDTTMDSDSSSDAGSGDEGIRWTRQEDTLLREAAVKFNGKAWKRIAEHCFPDGSRDKDQCLQRWRMISKPRSIKGPWTPEEDRQLKLLVNELGAEKWVLIASRLGSRTGKQCRERWHNHLDPTIDKSPFTAKEDELIFTLFAQLGSKWAEMSKLMPGRPDNAIKNHFNTSMQRKRRRLSLQDPTERRHSMPSLEFSPKAQPGPTHRRNGSRDFATEAHQQHHHIQPNGPGPGMYPRTIPTPPKTPDTKMSLKFASNMSRSISLGSSDRQGMNAPGTGAPLHQQYLPQNGPSRPNLPGIASIHKPQHPLVNNSSNSSNNSHYPYVASTMGGMVSPSSSTTTSSPIRMARSSSSMAISVGQPQSPYSQNHPESFSPQSQHHQSLNYALPRPSATRHESLGGHAGRFIRGHQHHRSLDIDPFSALAELANLAEKHREMPEGGRSINSTVTVIVQSKEELEPNQHHRQDTGGFEGGESMSRSGSSSSGPDLADVEDAVVKTMIERPLPTPGPLVMGRRFSALGHVKEEEHGDDAEDTQSHHHSYHIDARNNSSSPIGHSKGYSGHDLSSGQDPLSSGYRSKRFSMDFSTTSEPASEHDDDEDMLMTEENTHNQDRRVSPPSSISRPSASYMALRRGSVRELMAIDNLCL
ncbi:hypothetical protein BGX21_009021 [Mortierella sp. AD011]|nr:hypothetical protein BGX21_009021 [Mortierella sp. AD011]